MTDSQETSPIRIPPQYLSGIEKIILIDDESFNAIINALKNISPSFYTRNIVTEVALIVKNISSKDISDIIRTVISLNVARYSNEVSLKDWIDAVVQFVNNSKHFSSFSDEHTSALKNRLTLLLNPDEVIDIASKAKVEIIEHQYVYKKSQIFTDIRPIFGTELDKDITGTLIVHSLKIEYQEGADEKEIFLALDTRDIKELRKQIDIAEKKAEAIELMLKKAQVAYLNMED